MIAITYSSCARQCVNEHRDDDRMVGQPNLLKQAGLTAVQFGALSASAMDREECAMYQKYTEDKTNRQTDRYLSALDPWIKTSPRRNSKSFPFLLIIDRFPQPKQRRTPAVEMQVVEHSPFASSMLNAADAELISLPVWSSSMRTAHSPVGRHVVLGGQNTAAPA